MPRNVGSLQGCCPCWAKLFHVEQVTWITSNARLWGQKWGSGGRLPRARELSRVLHLPGQNYGEHPIKFGVAAPGHPRGAGPPGRRVDASSACFRATCTHRTVLLRQWEGQARRALGSAGRVGIASALPQLGQLGAQLARRQGRATRALGGPRRPGGLARWLQRSQEAPGGLEAQAAGCGRILSDGPQGIERDCAQGLHLFARKHLIQVHSDTSRNSASPA